MHMSKRESKRTVHTFLGEMADWQANRAKAQLDGGAFVHIGSSNISCIRCKTAIRNGSECWMHKDGSCECLGCHPKMPTRPVVLDVSQRECVVCGSQFQAPEKGHETDEDDEHGLCCSRKCRRTLDARNAKSSDEPERKQRSAP
jgi:hypothetical protein